MKKLMIYALIVTAGIFGAGCTPEEIGAGAIGVGIGIGIGRGHDHRHDRDHRRRPPRRHPRCDRWGCWDGLNQVQAAQNASDVSNLASKYQIPVSSAAKITQAFANSEVQGLDAFRAMGLTDKDFKAMMNHQLPSDTAVKTAAQKLDLSEQKGRQLLTAMMREFNAQAANVKSEYWQYCMSEGSWKTDRNRSCSNVNWPGCSPQTGAKFCY